ncbi:amidohydrolase family protein [Mediterraneibacter sp. ICN-202921]|uniref:amidohydrolase family protein n=1 Tax=Mediterraneibacter sp. ICN-202921 TaxID=3134657 RepID=UPI0030BCFEC7
MKPRCPKLEYTRQDKEFYDFHLKERMPEEIFDFHIHVNLPEHIPDMTEERVHSDWAFESGLILPCETAKQYGHQLFPDTVYCMAGFPWPIQEADLEAGNRYLKAEKEKGNMHPFMAVAPWHKESYIEEELPFFNGFKPYPDLVSTVKGADISIFTFMPHWQLEILNRHKKTVVLHLPRKGRIADPDNIRELLEMRQKYPDIQIVIAHFGRSFTPCYLEQALEEMKEDKAGFYWDTAAVLNPQVYSLAFKELPEDRILYGTDAPIMLWHGKRRWTYDKYINLVREEFSWNTHEEGKEAESHYTLFIYEQMRSILDNIEELEMGETFKRKLFSENAKRLLSVDNLIED